MKIILAQINPTVGDFQGNCKKIINSIQNARKKEADLILFSELVISGYPPEDFLLMTHFAKAAEKYLEYIIEASKDITVIVGLPRFNPEKKEKFLFNSAAVIENGILLGYQDKALLPTYDVFDEMRYFEPSLETKIWKIKKKKVAITICEDLWKHSGLVPFTDYRHDPVIELKKHNIDLLLNLSASPYYVSKFNDRLKVASDAAKTLKCPVLLCNQVGGNDSLIFDGYSLFVGANGTLINHAKGFQEDDLLVDLSKKENPIIFPRDQIRDIHNALVLGLRDYFRKQGFTKACFGLSGGVDSAVVACIAAEALGKENIMAIIMPSRFNAESSSNDAIKLIKNLGINHTTIPIETPFQSFLDLLEPHFQNKSWDSTEENLQARIRGMILMAFSNKMGHIVLSTGNKSELAMGYSTLYGDMCGGLGIISDVTKRQVYALANWYNREKEIIPQNIIQKAPSAELRANQKDSDSLPDYEIIDNILDDYVVEHHSPEEISEKHNYPIDLVMDLVQRIHRNEYKRRQSAPGLRISSKSFSVGRRFPIVQKWIS